MIRAQSIGWKNFLKKNLYDFPAAIDKPNGVVMAGPLYSTSIKISVVSPFILSAVMETGNSPFNKERFLRPLKLLITHLPLGPNRSNFIKPEVSVGFVFQMMGDRKS